MKEYNKTTPKKLFSLPRVESEQQCADKPQQQPRPAVGFLSSTTKEENGNNVGGTSGQCLSVLFLYIYVYIYGGGE